MKLLTRREIIELWQKQSDEIKDSFCCPKCRDILVKLESGFLYCENCEVVY